ncbi:hypothetical protein Hypma_013977 [Hypsizygus marmoreus]|uniref:Uncharacterized protein n=1 Tax=Hypsizygus marmoreus TaxID=39966 RepID=A0A369K685_HYPMA|nr:hypothetical protein Hypma_013977 [Hypsizygus marmoreus]
MYCHHFHLNLMRFWPPRRAVTYARSMDVCVSDGVMLLPSTYLDLNFNEVLAPRRAVTQARYMNIYVSNVTLFRLSQAKFALNANEVLAPAASGNEILASAASGIARSLSGSLRERRGVAPAIAVPR